MNNFNCNCSYCTNFTYLWRIGLDKVWVEIPKNASFVIKDSNRKMTKINHKDIKPNDKVIVIIRNPVERFKSLLSHYFLPKGGRYKLGNDWLKLINIKQTVNGDNICDIVVKNFEKLNFIIEPHHWNPQISFYPNNIFDYDYQFISMDGVNKNFNVSRKSNTSDSNLINITEKK